MITLTDTDYLTGISVGVHTTFGIDYIFLKTSESGAQGPYGLFPGITNSLHTLDCPGTDQVNMISGMTTGSTLVAVGITCECENGVVDDGSGMV